MRPLASMAAMAILCASLGLSLTPIKAVAGDLDGPYASQSNLRYKCETDGDRCAYYRCDRNDDHCERVSDYWSRDVGDKVVYRCDRDGDRCAYFRCDGREDDCIQVSRAYRANAGDDRDGDDGYRDERYSDRVRYVCDSDRCAYMVCNTAGDRCRPAED